ncbi:MAG: aldehyde dehydrogenase family protein [Sphingomicrobium sp.]
MLSVDAVRDRFQLLLPDQCHALVDGGVVEGCGARREHFYPATGEFLTTLVGSDAGVVDRAVTTARSAFDNGAWRNLDVAGRNVVLRRIAARMRAEAGALAAIQTLETGVPHAHAVSQHVMRAAENFEFFADVAATQAGQVFGQTGQYLSLSVREPVGVAAIFAPWNAPYILTSMKLAAALATGNSVIVKPSEFTPLSVLRLIQLCHEEGVPASVLNLVNGYGAETGRPLAEHPGVDAIGFVGGSETGKAIMTAAARRLAKVGLELGGKSANIICDSADLYAAVDGALLAIFSGAGQQCLAGSRILVQRGVATSFTDAFVARARRIRLGDPFDPATEMGPLAHAAHGERVKAMVDAATADGARLLTGGRVAAKVGPGFFEPTVLAVDDASLAICRDEVFGPVVTIQIFDTVDQAITLANDSKFGLAGYVWSNDLATVTRVARGVRTGTMWVNTPLARDLRAPFGGYRESGIGRDGRDGSIDLFTEEKTIMVPTGPLLLRRLGGED